ncbi:MAG: TonB-dependent receptor plug domain-containing protein [Chitinivibrionales bacterium]|nr:TonB-dependent receptor plug domain-containing protein [Chitinivibrionales bacterium]
MAACMHWHSFCTYPLFPVKVIINAVEGGTMQAHTHTLRLGAASGNALLFLVSLIWLPFAEKKAVYGTLSGTVIEVRKKTPVAGAQVNLIQTRFSDSTNQNGRFDLDSIPVGYYDIEIKAAEYLAKAVPTYLIKSGVNNGIEFVIEKDDKVRNLDKMVVTSKRLVTRSAEQSNSVVKLSREEVLKTPGSNQDINRVLQAMPSAIGGKDEGFNAFIVRGGNDNENIFIIDGMEINNLSHWGSEYSSGGAITILHNDFLKAVDFYAGGVPVRQPPVLSSVTDIQFRDGSMTDRRYQVDLNMAGFGAFAEGPIVKDNSSYMINARFSFLDIIEPLLDVGGLPQYQNGQMKLAWNLNKRNKLSANLIVGHETIEIEDDDGQQYVEDEGIHVNGGLIWSYKGNTLMNRVIFTGKYNDFVEQVTQHDSIVVHDYDNSQIVLQLKDDFSIYLRDKDVVSLGVIVEGKDQDELFGNDGYYIFGDTTSNNYRYFLGFPDSTRHVLIDTVKKLAIDTSVRAYRIGGYVGYTAHVGRFKLGLGVRNDYYTLAEKHGVSPRANIGYDAGTIGAFSLNGGLYHQFPAYAHFLDNDHYLWEFDLQRNVQAVLGYEKMLTEVIILGAETYYKHYDREPIYELKREPGYPDAGTVEVILDPDRYSHKRALGIELYLHKKKLDKLYYQLAYSLFNVEREYIVEGGTEWYNDENNLRNSLSMIVGSNFHKSHSVTIRMDLTEGYPYLKVDKEASTARYRTLYDVSNGSLSERRDPRVKISLRYDWTSFFRWGNITSYFEVQNLFNQRDVAYEYYEIGKKDVTRIMSRGILPVGGFTLDF